MCDLTSMKNLELYHMLNIAVEVFVILITYPSFVNYFSTTSVAIALKVSFSGRKRIFLFMESVQISPCSFVCEHEES